MKRQEQNSDQITRPYDFNFTTDTFSINTMRNKYSCKISVLRNKMLVAWSISEPRSIIKKRYNLNNDAYGKFITSVDMGGIPLNIIRTFLNSIGPDETPSSEAVASIKTAAIKAISEGAENSQIRSQQLQPQLQPQPQPQLQPQLQRLQLQLDAIRNKATQEQGESEMPIKPQLAKDLAEFDARFPDKIYVSGTNLNYIQQKRAEWYENNEGHPDYPFGHPLFKGS